MKGIAGLMAMMAAVVLAMMVVGFSIPISQSLGNEAGEAVTDIGAVAQLNAYSSNYVYDYMRQSARYSIHNKSYEIAQAGGNMEWSSSKVSQQLDKTYSCSDENPLEQMNCRLQEAAVERAANYGWKSSARCITNVNGENVNVSSDYSVFNASAITLDCDIKQRNMSRTVEDVELNFSTKRVRFQELSHTAYSYMNELQKSWTAGSYEEREINMCGAPDDEDLADLESDAAAEADSEIESGFSSISINTPEWLQLETSIVDVPEELRYGTNPENFAEGDVSTDIESGKCCEWETDDEGNRECVADYHNATVEVEPETSEVRVEAEDTERKVLINDGWENLVFEVENYVHSFS